MPCAAERVSLFMDGALPAAEERLFQDHLETCEPCQETLEAYLQVDALALYYFAEEN